MVISCSVPTCRNRFQKGGDVQFHSFPLRREDMSRRWAQAIGRVDWIPTRNSFVCSQHFTVDDYQIRPGKHKHFLKEEAIPSVFNPAMPRRRTIWRNQVSSSFTSSLPFVLPAHLEISPTPSPVSSTTSHFDTSSDFLPTTLPSGVSITPLKRSAPNPSSNHRDSHSNGSYQHKRLKTQSLPILHPSNNTSVFLTSKPSHSKPIPKLNPIYQKQDDNGDDEPVDISQFLSISLQPEDERKSNDQPLELLRKKCSYLQKEIQKRDLNIKSLQYQVKDLRKKMDSISVKKILNDSFKGVAYNILEDYLNNINLDSCEKFYSLNVKDFSKELYSISPEAYAFVKSQFDLPHQANVSHWLRSDEDETAITDNNPEQFNEEEENNKCDNSGAQYDNNDEPQNNDLNEQTNEEENDELYKELEGDNPFQSEIHIKMEPQIYNSEDLNVKMVEDYD